MPLRRVSITAIILFCSGVLLWIFTYGPAKRIFVVPDRTVTLRSAGEIDDLWRSSGIHGRIAVIFTRHLNHQLSGIAFPEMDYLDRALRQGMVRKVYYVVPDRFWAAVVLEHRERMEYIIEPRTTDTGFMILHEGGRIHAMPLSKYIPELENEKALVVIETAPWSQEEQTRIEGFLRSGQLRTDLTVIIGQPKQAESQKRTY